VSSNLKVDLLRVNSQIKVMKLNSTHRHCLILANNLVELLIDYLLIIVITAQLHLNLNEAKITLLINHELLLLLVKIIVDFLIAMQEFLSEAGRH